MLDEREKRNTCDTECSFMTQTTIRPCSYCIPRVRRATFDIFFRRTASTGFGVSETRAGRAQAPGNARSQIDFERFDHFGWIQTVILRSFWPFIYLLFFFFQLLHWPSYGTSEFNVYELYPFSTYFLQQSVRELSRRSEYHLNDLSIKTY